MSDSVYKRIDRAVYHAERVLVVGALVVMAVVVFLDVVHRNFSGDQSKLAMVLAKVGGWFGAELGEGTAAHEQIAAASPYLLFVLFTGLAYFGLRSTKRATPIPPRTALLGAVAMVVVTYGLIRLLLVLLPNGLIWSQNIALVLTLWVGFVGASMCTHEGRHLKVEAAQRALPEKLRPYIGFVSGLVTTAVCVALLWVSLRYVLAHHEDYAGTEGKGGLVPGTDLPKYLGFAVLPLSFAFMAVRFLAKALAALRGEVETPLDPLEAAGGIPRVPDGDLPSAVSTEAMPRPTGEELGSGVPEQPSSIDTMSSKIRMAAEPGAPRPQSKVPTDAHGAVPLLPGVDDIDDIEDDASFDPERTREIAHDSLALLDDTRDLDPEGFVASLEAEERDEAAAEEARR